MTCNACKKDINLGDWPYCPHESVFNLTARRFDPIVVHRDAAGNVRFPASTDAPVPEGFQKIEIFDFHHARKLEKEIEQRQTVASEQFRRTRQAFLDGQLKENRRVMDHLSSKFTDRGKNFYAKMREASMAKQAQGPRPISPAFYIEALTQNSSNREGYSDARTGWQNKGK